MALTDFLRINLPYGLLKNKNKEWVAFNRDHRPLGWNDSMQEENDILNLYDKDRYPTKYLGLTEDKIISLNPTQIERDEDNQIFLFFLYNTDGFPDWEDYSKKLKVLAELQRAK